MSSYDLNQSLNPLKIEDKNLISFSIQLKLHRRRLGLTEGVKTMDGKDRISN
jgi:hypothetical protein